MKTPVSILITLFFVLILSCKDEPFTNVGFDSALDPGSSGTSVIHVEDRARAIYLKGKVNITEGEVKIELLNPVGTVEYELVVSSPNIVGIDKSFQATEGDWSLKYSSIQGKGSISLHMHY